MADGISVDEDVVSDYKESHDRRIYEEAKDDVLAAEGVGIYGLVKTEEKGLQKNVFLNV